MAKEWRDNESFFLKKHCRSLACAKERRSITDGSRRTRKSADEVGGGIRGEDNGKSRRKGTKIKVTIGILSPNTPKSFYPPAFIHSGECFMEIASAADASALYAPGRSGLNLHRDFISRGEAARISRFNKRPPAFVSSAAQRSGRWGSFVQTSGL